MDVGPSSCCNKARCTDLKNTPLRMIQPKHDPVEIMLCVDSTADRITATSTECASRAEFIKKALEQTQQSLYQMVGGYLYYILVVSFDQLQHTQFSLFDELTSSVIQWKQGTGTHLFLLKVFRRGSLRRSMDDEWTNWGYTGGEKCATGGGDGVVWTDKQNPPESVAYGGDGKCTEKVNIRSNKIKHVEVFYHDGILKIEFISLDDNIKNFGSICSSLSKAFEMYGGETIIGAEIRADKFLREIRFRTSYNRFMGKPLTDMSQTVSIMFSGSLSGIAGNFGHYINTIRFLTTSINRKSSS